MREKTYDCNEGQAQIVEGKDRGYIGHGEGACHCQMPDACRYAERNQHRQFLQLWGFPNEERWDERDRCYEQEKVDHDCVR